MIERRIVATMVEATMTSELVAGVTTVTTVMAMAMAKVAMAKEAMAMAKEAMAMAKVATASMAVGTMVETMATVALATMARAALQTMVTTEVITVITAEVEPGTREAIEEVRWRIEMVIAVAMVKALAQEAPEVEIATQ